VFSHFFSAFLEIFFMNTFLPLSQSDQQLAADLGSSFLIGSAASAYQIEGGHDADGRGPSIWDTFSHTPGKTVNGETGDVACDHYRLWRQDVDLMSQLALQAYRFSISWSRVQPLGYGAWNEAGIGFYDRLVDQLLAKGIEPHATLYHWDLPQALQDKGGWASRDVAAHFADYARRMTQLLGDRVKSIATHNEPWCTAVLGNEIGKFAPGFKDLKLATQVSHHLLLSHGLAMNAMRSEGKKAALGIVLNQSPATAATDSIADQEGVATEYAKFVRWYMDPIFLGQYPTDPSIMHYPEIHAGDMDCIKQPIDFLGVNYYSRNWVSRTEPRIPSPNLLGVTDMGWEIYPQGLEELLVGLHKQYKLPPIYITENGMAAKDKLINGAVDDQDRLDFTRRHLEAIVRARHAGVDVRGYLYWSFMDNYEWDSGYDKRFGIVYVDYATQKRIPKASAYWLREMSIAASQMQIQKKVAV
jgi:beta-glucosidase